jgi:hypothetical protein
MWRKAVKQSTKSVRPKGRKIAEKPPPDPDATKKPKPKKAPTDAEMRRLVAAWAREKGIDAPGLAINVWDEWGTGDDVLTVRKPPDHPAPTAAERREQAEAERQRRAEHARRSFVQWWGEFVAVVNDLYGQLAEVETSPRLDDLRRSGVDVVWLHNLYVQFDELSTKVMRPPFDSPIHLQKPYGLMIGKQGGA